MSLDKQISTFRIVANSTNHDLPVQNMEIDWPAEAYKGADFTKEFINGDLKSNIAGVRASISIDYEANIDQADWRSLINDILTHFITNGNTSMEFYPDATKTTASDKIDVVIDEDINYLSQYQNQIQTFVPSIRLRGQTRQTSIPSGLEA